MGPAEVPGPDATVAGGARALDIFDSRKRSDPYPAYRALLEAGRFHWLYPGSPRIAVVTRYADCMRVLQDPAVGHVSMADSAFRVDTEADEGLRSMLRANPPTHTRLRRLVSKAFTAGRIARFGPLARQLAADLLDDAVGRGEVDLVGSFARPVPLRVICTLLGVPPRDEVVFGDWASALTRGLDPDQLLSPPERIQRTEATRGFVDYFGDLIAKRRAAPADDLLSDLVAVQEQDDRLSDRELLDLCVLLLVAGYETTVNLVANAVLALARDPEQYATLRADRALVPATIEETLRFDPQIQYVGRTVLADVDLGGQTLRAGDGVIALLAGAQRDPEVFPDPDRFDITRYAGPAARHLGFGLGIHYCLGAPLARLEAEIMLAALLDRVERIEIAAEPLPYRPHLSVRGVSALPVRLTPA
ncbi:cytochrome [Pseudofrankia sp. BMG5.36]|nr:cytochrome [Pseudofrankia sp. BMG5.36]